MRRILCALLMTAWLGAQPLPVSTPEREGFSPERLARLHGHFDRLVKEGRKAGAITMLVRNGRIVDWRTYGYRDAGKNLPMEKDTICRIWSMTKPVTSVAAMMLVEEGRLTLDDRVEKYIPAFKDVKVLQGGTAADPVLASPGRPITVKHLLTHTAGLGYGRENEVITALYGRANIFVAPTLKDFASHMASLPLVNPPGEKYLYSVATDVLGYVVEAASGMPFDRFVQSRILDPLQMTDTGFSTPESKANRVARTYSYSDGKLVPMDDSAGVNVTPAFPTAAWDCTPPSATIRDSPRCS